MKKKSLAIALLSLLPLAAAHAQTSVQIYGIADASVGIEDTDAPGEDSRTVISSGTQSTSRIGFRGTEDLGNGLKALFNIEAGVALDNGAQDAAGTFQRRAVSRRSFWHSRSVSSFCRAFSAASNAASASRAFDSKSRALSS